MGNVIFKSYIQESCKFGSGLEGVGDWGLHLEGGFSRKLKYMLASIIPIWLSGAEKEAARCAMVPQEVPH